MWPAHCHFSLLTFWNMSVTFTFCRITSLWILLIPSMNRSIALWVTCSRWAYFTVICHASAPHVITGMVAPWFWGIVARVIQRCAATSYPSKLNFWWFHPQSCIYPSARFAQGRHISGWLQELHLRQRLVQEWCVRWTWPIGYYGVKLSFQLLQDWFTTSLKELRGYSVFTGSLPILKLFESRLDLIDIDFPTIAIFYISC